LRGFLDLRILELKLGIKRWEHIQELNGGNNLTISEIRKNKNYDESGGEHEPMEAEK